MSTAITTNPRLDPTAVDAAQGRSLALGEVRQPPRDYWNARAGRFAAVRSGLAAVCSYGMPEYHNRYIHWRQASALVPWLAVPPGARVLEIGCGIGRWTRRLARTSAVVGFDLSTQMIGEARRRAAAADLDRQCRFFVADAAAFALDGTFDRILGVTVLQHILDEGRLASAVANIVRHLAPDGRAILLEAAPTRPTTRCDSAVFVARPVEVYLDHFRQAGLHCVGLTGVDPAPFRTWVLPYYRSAPRPIAAAVMFGATMMSAPVDLLAPPALRRRAWHKVFVLEHAGASR